jgi:predicted  nucleic acid-binding Zn-ribbon protein
MSRSKTLYKIQQFDSELDSGRKRIQEIDRILGDQLELDQAHSSQKAARKVLFEKQNQLVNAEASVAEQNHKIEQNQKKLYSGAVSNPKELEDLQKEYLALEKYLSVLEERQLEAMLANEEAQTRYDQVSADVERISSKLADQFASLRKEQNSLQLNAEKVQAAKAKFLEDNPTPDLPKYEELRKTLNGIAVTLMVSESCASCGASIPSAIAQAARSPGNLISCPSCKRILYPG